MDSAKRLEQVNQKILAACDRVGRSAEDVTLVGVSKKKAAEDIKELYDCGLRDFAENYLQEALEKMPLIPRASLTYHFIGHLQSKKVKSVVENFDLIHSGDRLKIIEAINLRSKDFNKKCSVLLQVNIADEESKSGFNSADLLAEINSFQSFENISICGLMSFPPLDKPQKSRDYFKKSKSLFEEIKVKLNSEVREQFKILSMGTTSDFEVAIEEGSTMVRVGTALFGERR